MRCQNMAFKGNVVALSLFSIHFNEYKDLNIFTYLSHCKLCTLCLIITGGTQV